MYICILEKYLPEHMLVDIEEMLDSTLNDIFKKYDVDYQIKQAHNILKNQWNKIDGRLLFCKIYFIYIYYIYIRLYNFFKQNKMKFWIKQ